MTRKFPEGTRVRFVLRDQTRVGTVVNTITFNGKTRHGVRTDDGRVYDVWPDLRIYSVTEES